MNKCENIIKKLKSGTVPALIELYGTDRNILNNQCQRYIDLLMKFSTAFGVSDVEIFSSPGRTEIGGNHTDHNFGHVLAGAVNLDNVAIAAGNNSNLVRVKSDGYPDFEVDLTQLNPDSGEKYTSASLVRGVCAKIKELGFKIGGFDAMIDGRVPKGSGLSSSASFEVLIGTIISQLFNNGKIDPVQIAIIGQYAENKFFGKPCGLMDQVSLLPWRFGNY